MPAKRRKITPHMRRRLVKDVRAGLPLHRAAARAGIPKRTFFTWSAKAKDGDPDYVPLFRRARVRPRRMDAGVGRGRRAGGTGREGLAGSRVAA